MSVSSIDLAGRVWLLFFKQKPANEVRISNWSSDVCSSDLGMTSDYNRCGVVGGGAWGTALAQLLAAEGAPVRLWAREAEVVAAINAERRNPLFLDRKSTRPNSSH